MYRQEAARLWRWVRSGSSLTTRQIYTNFVEAVEQQMLGDPWNVKQKPSTSKIDQVNPSTSAPVVIDLDSDCEIIPSDTLKKKVIKKPKLLNPKHKPSSLIIAID